MIKQAKAGQPIDVDAVPPPVATGATQPSAPASSQPVQPAAAPEGLGTSNTSSAVIIYLGKVLIKLRYFMQSLY